MAFNNTFFGSNFSRTFSDKLASFVSMDLFSTVRKAKVQFFTDLNESIAQVVNSDDGRVRLSNGLEIDMNTTAGVNAFSAHINILSSISQFVDDSFGKLTQWEKSLHNLVQ